MVSTVSEHPPPPSHTLTLTHTHTHSHTRVPAVCRAHLQPRPGEQDSHVFAQYTQTSGVFNFKYGVHIVCGCSCWGNTPPCHTIGNRMHFILSNFYLLCKTFGKFQAEGAYFTAFYANSPVCAPSRKCVFRLPLFKFLTGDAQFNSVQRVGSASSATSS